MNYTRALHSSDYVLLAPYVLLLSEFERRLRNNSIPFRKDHEHRAWEYASILQQMSELLPDTPTRLRVLDTGSGGSYFPLFLSVGGYQVSVSDSMEYGDIREAFTDVQTRALDINMPVYEEPVEKMGFMDDSFDVTLCVSVIEHVHVRQYEKALHELCRVTKPGGYLFLTSDYFRDDAQADLSPYRHIQHTAFTEATVRAIPDLIPVEFVGDVDLGYRGDFVNNYSFVNCAMRKLHHV